MPDNKELDRAKDGMARMSMVSFREKGEDE